MQETPAFKTSRVTRHLAWTSVRVIVTVAIFAYLLRDIDWNAAVAAVSRFSSEYLIEFFLLIAADRVLMLSRWVLLMRMTTDMPARELARIFFISSFVGSFLPAGVGGDAARAISVTRHTNQPGAAVASVVIDRLLGLQAIAISGGIGVLVADELVPEPLRRLTLVLSAILILASILGLFAERVAWYVLPARIHSSKVGRALIRMGQELAAYRQRPGIVWRVAVLSFAVQGVRIVLAWVIGRGLGIPLHIGYYFVFMPLNIVVTLLPVSVGGFGLPQGAMVWSLAPLGVSATQAFLLSMLFTLSGTIANLPGAVLYVMGRARAASI